MNYLAHYFIDAKDASPDHTLGLILPDLVRTFNRGWRIPHEEIEFGDGNESLTAIHEGALRHHLADEVFHSSDFFRNASSRTTKVLVDIDFEGFSKHKFFLSHVMVEMVLDRVLMSKHSKLCDEFYEKLEKVEESSVSSYLNQIIHVEDTSGFVSFLNRFTNSAFIFDYQSNEGFIFALNRVYSKAGKRIFTTWDEQKLVEIVLELEEYLHGVGYTYLTEIKNELN